MKEPANGSTSLGRDDRLLRWAPVPPPASPATAPNPEPRLPPPTTDMEPPAPTTASPVTMVDPDAANTATVDPAPVPDSFTGATSSLTFRIFCIDRPTSQPRARRRASARLSSDRAAQGVLSVLLGCSQNRSTQQEPTRRPMCGAQALNKGLVETHQSLTCSLLTRT